MTAMAFVHLRTHSEFSVVDGMLRIDEAVAAARADDQVALGLTDLNNLFGAVQFYKACRGQGLKPLIGADLWMEPESGDKQPSRLLLLVQDRQGYLNLCELLARGWTRNAQRSRTSSPSGGRRRALACKESTPMRSTRSGSVMP